MTLLIQNRRQFLAVMAATCASGFVIPARAQNTYPSRSVTLYVGASPGGAPDAAARMMGKVLAEIWGQPVIIDNKPGVSGLLAAVAVATAPPDGHSLCILLDTVMNTVPLLTEKMAIDPIKGLKPIGMLGSFPLVLVANPSTNWRDLKQVVAAAKASPGKLNVGTSGLGSSGHVALEMFDRAAGVKMTHVPYKGGIPMLQDVMGGQLPLGWSSVGAGAPLISSGRLIAVAVASLERFSLLPSVPTFSEHGYANFTAGNWLGLMGSATMPDGLAQKIYEDILKVSANSAYRKILLEQGIEARMMPSTELGHLINTEYERNKALFTELGMMARK